MSIEHRAQPDGSVLFMVQKRGITPITAHTVERLLKLTSAIEQ